MRLKPLFKQGTGGEIDNEKLIELLRGLREEAEPPAEVIEEAKKRGRERLLAEAAKVRAERETG